MTFFFIFAAMAGSSIPAAEQSQICVAKRHEIEEQIAHARARGRQGELRGLKKALAANQRDCTRSSLEVERNRNIAKASNEVREREEALRAARRKGDRTKIARQEAKLEQARLELEEAGKPLEH